jgi:Sec-independent protein translocase protein TatA
MAYPNSRWEKLQESRGVGFPPVREHVQMEIPICSALRIRREDNGRDFMNSRIWDNFRATPPTQTSSEALQKSEEPRFMDMNPQSSRQSVGQFRFQQEYMPGNEVPSSTNSTNPYLQRLDAAGSDARNIIREFRSAVTEDNRERDVEASKKLNQRQFQDRWLPPQITEEVSSLEAYELLRPKQYFDFDYKKPEQG